MNVIINTSHTLSVGTIAVVAYASKLIATIVTYPLLLTGFAALTAILHATSVNSRTLKNFAANLGCIITLQFLRANDEASANNRPPQEGASPCPIEGSTTTELPMFPDESDGHTIDPENQPLDFPDEEPGDPSMNLPIHTLDEQLEAGQQPEDRSSASNSLEQKPGKLEDRSPESDPSEQQPERLENCSAEPEIQAEKREPAKSDPYSAELEVSADNQPAEKEESSAERPSTRSKDEQQPGEPEDCSVKLEDPVIEQESAKSEPRATELETPVDGQPTEKKEDTAEEPSTHPRDEQQPGEPEDCSVKLEDPVIEQESAKSEPHATELETPVDGQPTEKKEDTAEEPSTHPRDEQQSEELEECSVELEVPVEDRESVLYLAELETSADDQSTGKKEDHAEEPSTHPGDEQQSEELEECLVELEVPVEDREFVPHPAELEALIVDQLAKEREGPSEKPSTPLEDGQQPEEPEDSPAKLTADDLLDLQLGTNGSSLTLHEVFPFPMYTSGNCDERSANSDSFTN
ncbi:MAG: hypothetical protein LBB26_01430 [Puniceicoccales bacterium]|nr:hypothetical protein [Puniceicoccales bacterium]